MPDDTRIEDAPATNPLIPIAIVGIGCRLPSGIAGAPAFWRMLEGGAEATRGAPEARAALGAERPRLGGFLDGIEQFDHELFGLSLREACLMDPEQRLLLETTWEALDDAGVDPGALAGSAVGVFVGMQSNEYAELRRRRRGNIDAHLVTGASRNAAAGRISYALGAVGPSMVVDADRSSSLVAVHLACQSLRSGECRVALAAGANLVLTGETTRAFELAGLLATDGRCKFADASADGIVRSEAIGVVVLKPLSDAVADGDRVYAVIRGSAVMNAGSSGGDLMTPSVESQQKLLALAYRNAGVVPGRVGYVEAHGTGTPVGDPVELSALAAVLGEGRLANSRCAVGSVKTNLGHSEAAAGIIGLIKTALVLDRGVIPPSLHCQAPNPKIPFDSSSPIRLAQGLEAWAPPKDGGARIAGVSSFGITGTIAHVVLEEAHRDGSTGEARPPADRPVRFWNHRRCWFDVVEQPGDAKVDAASVGPLGAPRADGSVRPLVGELRKLVAQVLKTPVEEIDPMRPLREMGLTSLMSVELRDALGRRLGISVAAPVLFNYPTIERLAAFLVEERARRASVASSPAPARTPPPRVAARAVASASASPSPVAPHSTHGPIAPVDARPTEEPIAIVGMACRFPGAHDASAFWELLRGGVDAIREVPADRWDAGAYYDPDPDAPGKMYTRWGGFIHDVARFDAAFFGISPREAQAMDPQQRLLLELTWEALEDANMDPSRLGGRRGGVFVGLQSFAEYARLKTVDESRIGSHDAAGDSISIAAGRLSYTLGLTGPAVSIDTACSGSLVALHFACQSLRSGESDLALAGGVNVIAAPEVTLALSKAKMLSPRGRCRTFDASADGYVRGEGCGMLVLKRLSDAIASGDEIHAVVRATALNQDGRSSGLTAPNGLAQEALIRQALATAKIDAASVTYLETHGTGTPLGDPIEYRAVANVLSEGRDAGRPLLVGSVKTNIGHLESAAGIAGLVKVVLSLEHGEIPAHLHLSELNPEIDRTLPVRITSERVPWPAEAPRIAGVNSFGFSGTNAHAILERPNECDLRRPRPSPAVDRRPLHVLTLSAKDPTALRELAARYAAYLEAGTAPSFADVAFTAQTRRAHFHHRLAVVAPDSARAAHKLRAFLAGEHPGGLFVGDAMAADGIQLAFLFTGQGSHYAGMGKQLFETEPVFRRAIQRCAEASWGSLDRPLESVLYGEDEALLQDQNYSQIALFALEYALYETWRSWGVSPDVLLGHSLGEYAAACAAGILSLEGALKTIAVRGPLAAALPDKGQAAAVWASADQVEPIVAKYSAELAIAAFNSPERLLVSGTARALASAVAEMEAAGIQCKQLNGLVAVHSPLMDPMLDPFEEHMRTVELGVPSIPVVSSVTGRLVVGDEMRDPVYWRRHVREPVRFAQAMRTLHDEGANAFLEIGPHHTLVRLGEECLPLDATATWQTSLSKERSPWEQILDALGRLYVQGVPIDFEAFQRGAPRRPVKLPTYPWQGGRYWVKRNAEKRSRTRGASGRHPLLGERLTSPLRDVQFESAIELASLPFLRDHKLWNTVVVPGAFHLERVLAAAAEVTRSERLEVSDVVFPEAIVLGRDDESRLSHLVLAPEGEGRWSVTVASVAPEVDDGAWTTHLAGSVKAVRGAANEEKHGEVVPTELLDPATALERSGADLYAQMEAWGYGLGPAFQWMAGTLTRHGEAWFRLQMPAAASARDALVFHPSLLDALFQIVVHVPAPNGTPPTAGSLFVPVSIERLVVLARPEPGKSLFAQVRIHDSASNERRADVRLFSAAGLCAELRGVQLKLASREALFRARSQHLDQSLYNVEWEPGPQVFDESQEAAAHRRAGGWLVFSSDSLGDELAAQLADAGERAFIVHPGEAFAADGDRLSVPPGDEREIDRVVEHAASQGLPLRGVVYGWGFGDGAQDIDRALSRATDVVHLARRLAARATVWRPKLWVVTRGAQLVPSASADAAKATPTLVSALEATLWGLGRTIATEMPMIWGGLVDLDPARSGDADEAIDLFEHTFRPDGFTEVAFRQGRRLVPRLRPSANGRFDAHARGRRLRADATYLVTGGLGGLGPEIARALVDAGARHLALVGRHPAKGHSAEVLEELAKTGATIRFVRADVSKLDELSAAVDWIDRELPPLGGVIHAAGVLADALVTDQDRDKLAQSFAPKVRGACNLDNALRGRPVDFVLHFSSVAPLIGNHGQANYAAANSFLDAYGAVQRAAGIHAVSVNWGPFGEVGMAADLEREFYERWGLQPISPRQGAKLAVALALSEASPVNVAVMPCDWAQFARSWSGSTVPAMFAEVVEGARRDGGATEAPASDILDRLAAATPEERQGVLMDAVRNIVAEILGIDGLPSFSTSQRLEELGVDSLLSMAIVRALQSHLRIALPKNALTLHPTLERLVGYVLRELDAAASA